jgi:hypothetical protein
MVCILRPVWILPAIALLVAAAGVAGAEEDDVEDEPDANVAVESAQGELAVQYFDQVVFGRQGEGRADAVHSELNFYLRQKIATLDFVCGLNAPQRQRLHLAGRGDIKRLLDRVDERRQKVATLGGDQPDPNLKVFQLEAEAMQRVVRSDPFGGNSMYAKMRARALTPEQKARGATFLRGDRVTGVRLDPSKPEGPDEVREIRFPVTTFGDQDMKRVESMTLLRSLVLDSTAITDAGLVHLKRLANLEELDLGNTKINGPGLAHLEGLSALRDLDLRRTDVSNENLARLAGLTQLRRLHLDQTPVGDAGLVHLAALGELRFLFLCQSQISDAGLAKLKHLTNLSHLDLEGTQVTDAGIGHLTAMTSLQVLDLRVTRVTDKGIARLGKLKSLRHVYLFDTPVTDAGIEALQRSLPNAKLMR